MAEHTRQDVMTRAEAEMSDARRAEVGTIILASLTGGSPEVVSAAQSVIARRVILAALIRDSVESADPDPIYPIPVASA